VYCDETHTSNVNRHPYPKGNEQPRRQQRVQWRRLSAKEHWFLCLPAAHFVPRSEGQFFNLTPVLLQVPRTVSSTSWMKSWLGPWYWPASCLRCQTGWPCRSLTGSGRGPIFETKAVQVPQTTSSDGGMRGDWILDAVPSCSRCHLGELDQIFDNWGVEYFGVGFRMIGWFHGVIDG